MPVLEAEAGAVRRQLEEVLERPGLAAMNDYPDWSRSFARALICLGDCGHMRHSATELYSGACRSQVRGVGFWRKEEDIDPDCAADRTGPTSTAEPRPISCTCSQPDHREKNK
jgi:hypothetical protein